MAGREEVLVIAHRGFRGIAPENTLLAARKGLHAGADWWELDVAASSDGVLVVLHDDGLARTTDAAAVYPERSPWSVYDFRFDELRRLDAGSWYETADPFGQVRSGRVGPDELASFVGLKIPSLREALELTKNEAWRVNVEIKDATGRACDGWIVERTVNLVRELGLVDRVMISSFNHDYVRRARAAEPRLRCGALVEPPLPDPVALLRGTGAASLNPGLRGLTEPLVREVREAGYDVYVWTVNEVADMERIISWGVTGIFTDFPDRLIALLGS